MRLSGRRSSNVEDRRGRRISGRKTAGGGLGILMLALVAMYFGVDPALVLQMAGDGSGSVQEAHYVPTEEENGLADFVSVVLADTEDTWAVLLRKEGVSYRPPKLVLFSGAVESACGLAQAAMGPFYCPGDEKVYIDLSFYKDLKSKLNAPGDFAQAYVIAHEVGHHIQNVLGRLNQVHGARSRVSEVEYNRLTVRLELQADCYSGVWAYHADQMRNILEPGDIDEAVHAASMIGDDRLQKRSRGYVTPDSFTHGTSAQRSGWFRRGFETGEIGSCNTFESKI